MGESSLGVALVLTQDSVSPQLKSLGSTLGDNRMAIRELAMGVTMMGASFMAMGVALSQSSNQTAQAAGRFLMLSGSIMTAIGSAVQFVSAISKTIDALQKLAASEIFAEAMANPLLPLLGVGAAAALTFGVTKGISSMNSGNTKVDHTTNVSIDGKVVATAIKPYLVQNAQQNAYNSGLATGKTGK